MNSILQIFLYYWYNDINVTGAYYEESPKYYESMKYMHATLLSTAYTNLFNPIHLMIWMNLKTIFSLKKIAPFVYILGVLGGMGFCIYISEVSIIMSIGFGCSSLAFVLTIFLLFYSSGLAPEPHKIPEGGWKKTEEDNEIPNPGNTIGRGLQIAENYNNLHNNGGNDEHQSFAVDLKEIVASLEIP